MMVRTFAWQEEGWLKCGVTQDKSNRVQGPQIANGGIGFTRVVAAKAASRTFRYIVRSHSVFIRLAFLAGLVPNLLWRSGIVSSHRKQRSSMDGTK